MNGYFYLLFLRHRHPLFKQLINGEEYFGLISPFFRFDLSFNFRRASQIILLLRTVRVLVRWYNIIMHTTVRVHVRTIIVSARINSVMASINEVNNYRTVVK